MSRTFTRRGGAVAAALALGVTPTVLGVVPAADVQLTTPAQAAVTQGPGYRTWATFIGIDIVNGKRTICISSGEAVPSSLPTPAPVADGKTAYLMWRYLGTNDDVTAAALAVVVKREHDEHPGEVEKGLAELDAATRSAIEARAKEMLAEAQEKAGPYDLTMDLKAKAGSNPTTGTVEDIAVLGRGGEPVNLDANITLTLSGPGVFTRNGKRTITVPTLSAAQSLGWKATAAGKVTVSGTVEGLPPTRFERYVAPVPYEQNMAGLYAGLTDIRGGDPKEEPTRVDCTPKIATQIITDQDTSGALTLKDAWKVTGDCKNKSFPVTITWYHVPTKPTAPSATVPADAKSLGSSTFTVTTDAQGTASGTATGKKVTLPGGAVVARERIATVEGVKGSWSPFGVASESMLVPCAVQLRTKLATAAVNEPGKIAIADTVTATSNCTNRSVDAEVTLFRDTAKPVLAPAAPATATQVGTTKVSIPLDASGQGEATTTPWVVDLPKTARVWYTAQEKVITSPGDETTPAVTGTGTSQYGVPDETVEIAPPTTPSSTTSSTTSSTPSSTTSTGTGAGGAGGGGEAADAGAGGAFLDTGRPEDGAGGTAGLWGAVTLLVGGGIAGAIGLARRSGARHARRH